jgi:dTDP-4-dehydrorhamnose reductase
MKILVLGVSGMAGHTIALYFQERGHDVVGFSTTPFNYCKNIIGNVFEFEGLRKILVEEKFDAVINCIGILNQTAEENRSMAIYLNSYLPHSIADLLKESTTKLIHMSTDCVFAGNTGPYKEHSFRDGKTFYDRTKALGEVDDNFNLTFRNSIIGPDLKENGIGLFNWFMKQNGEIKGYKKAIWTGVTTLTLAKAMEAALEVNLTGIYNLVNNKSIPKYDLIQLFNKYFKNNEISILEEDNFSLDKTLVNTRTDFSFNIPSYEEMISEMREWVGKNKTLYNHYTLL